jgi:hypothetical protein
MAVRALHDVNFWYAPHSQPMSARRGQEFTGDQGVWLAQNCPRDFVVVGGHAGWAVDFDPAAVDAAHAAANPGPESPDVEPDPDGESTGIGTGDGPPPAPAEDGGEFDPRDHTGPQVIDYVRANPGERARVRAVEAGPDGKNRTTVLVALAEPAS